MDFGTLLNIAAKNDRKAQKQLTEPTSLLSTKFSAPKKDVKAVKGVQSAAVRAFLEKQQKEEQEKVEKAKRSREVLLQRRLEAHNGRKAHAMASRTKDNLKVFEGCHDKEGVQEQRPLAPGESDVDLKHLFTKHDSRVARMPSESIPNRLQEYKEREKQRREAAREKEKQLQLEKEQEERDRKQSAEKSREEKLKMKSRDSSEPAPPATSTAQFKIPKRPQPPPMSFQQLLAIAEKKQAGVLDESVKVLGDKQSSASTLESSRPMTKEEKERIQRRQTKEYQDWLNYGGPPPPSLSADEKSRRKKDSAITKRVELPSSNARLESKITNGQAAVQSNNKVSSQQSSGRSDSRLSTLKGSEMPRTTIDKCDQQVSVRKDTASTTQRSSDLSKKAESSISKSRSDTPFRSSQGIVRESKPPISSSTNSGFNFSNPGVLGEQIIEQLKQRRREMADRGEAVPSMDDMIKKIIGKLTGSSNTNFKFNFSDPGVLGEQLIEQLKQRRREMADSGEAVPSMDDMIKEIIENLTGGSSSDSQSNRVSSTKSKAVSDVNSGPRRIVDNGKLPDLEEKKSVPRGAVISSSSAKSSAQLLPKTQKQPEVLRAVPKSNLSNSSLPKNGSSLVDTKKARESTTKDATSRSQQEKNGKPLSTWDRVRQQTSQMSRPKPVSENLPKKRRIESDSDEGDSSLEEDEEEDDDMADFIDDECEENGGTDYSVYIRKMFNYDRRKYVDESDDDLSNMDASFSQVMKEEARSTRLGKQEDAEDERKEAEEKRLKLLKKMNAKKSRLK